MTSDNGPPSPPEAQIGRDTLEEFDRRFATIDSGTEVKLDNPAGALRETSAELARLLQEIDLSAITVSPGWWNRFSGAYLQSQVELEAQVKHVEKLFKSCRTMSLAVKNRSEEFRHKKEVLHKALLALPDLEAWAASKLAKSKPTAGTEEDWLHTRLENKRAQLKVTLVSGQLMVAQLDMAIRNIEFLLDVHFELENRLYPVWKQYVEQTAANLSGSGNASRKPEEISVIARAIGTNIITSVVGVE